MPEIDDELIARALRWCAEAGRHASADEVRAALAPLSWDELLAARALLADPPPTRPLGPRALAELARGAAPAEAAAREQAGELGDAGPPLPAPPGAAPARPRGGGSRRGRRAAAPVIRRARDRATPPAPPAPAWPRLDALFESEGRAVLERLVRERGARRAPLVAALAAGWRRADGAPPDEADLARLLDAHGLAHGFERRERDELLHALRAAGGLRPAAAAAVGLSVEGLEAALRRLGAAGEAEAIRAARRDELRRRELLSDRAQLLLAEEARLEDLGLLQEFVDDVRARLPEHVRALRASTEGPLAPALARSLALGTADVARLAGRLGLALDAPRGAPAPRARGPRPRAPRPRPAGGRRPAPRRPGKPRAR